MPGYEVSWNCYDRLISHEMKTGPNGQPYYDKDKFKPELADDMNIGDMSVTFKLKKNATFQDGTPVKAKDVKWSLDRAVTVGGFPTFQMRAGSLTKPEQFVVVDDTTVRVDFMKKDRLTIPDLAVVVPAIYNSELVKKNATEKDPWGMEYTKLNTAGSGAYRVVNWTAGTEVVMERNDNWKGGPLPKIKRVIWRMVPSAGNRRALLERGDADISYELPNQDFAEMKRDGKVNVVSLPISNGIQYLGMNVTQPPFDNLKARQALMLAIAQEDFLRAQVGDPEIYRVCNAPLVCGSKYEKSYGDLLIKPDFEKAKALLKEAGYDGTPIVLMQSTDLQVLTNLAPVAKAQMERAGFKVDLVSMDWQTLVARRVKKEPPSQGGWHAFLTSWVAADILNPVMTGFLNASCDSANWGWPCDQQMEKLRDDFARETDPARQKAIAEQVQLRVIEYPTHVILGQFTQPTGLRTNIDGLLHTTALALWNVEKK